MPKLILQQIENFYRDLYTSQFSGSEELFENFVENVVLPQLSEVDKNYPEGELSPKNVVRFSKRSAMGSPLEKTVSQLSFMSSSLSFLRLICLQVSMQLTSTGKCPFLRGEELLH